MTAHMLKNYKSIFIFIFILLLAGCVSRIDLAYEPVMEKQESNHTILHVQSLGVQNFEGKPKGTTVGTIENDVFSDWIINALKSELANAGYSITENKELIEPEAIVESIETHPLIYNICPGQFRGKDGWMSIEMSVKQGDKEIFTKVYQSRRGMKANLFVLKSSIEKTLRRSLQDICRQFVEDLNAELLLVDKRTNKSF